MNIFNTILFFVIVGIALALNASDTKTIPTGQSPPQPPSGRESRFLGLFGGVFEFGQGNGNLFGGYGTSVGSGNREPEKN
ncbi:unnamed protein product [Orchesella dallaii]|uniref:Uncharacterized protein n=1 Tax=Orchesella dallaii TaxID=48710 RepID=A0ABP1RYV8_9HEXA